MSTDQCLLEDNERERTNEEITRFSCVPFKTSSILDSNEATLASSLHQHVLHSVCLENEYTRAENDMTLKIQRF